jgi:hydroxymethylbilane synthase
VRQLIRIATRKSALALWQSNFVKSQLLQHYPDLTVELIPMTTEGDRVLDLSLSKIGGKGLFVKELENALLNGSADIAVHSMKDIPMHLPDGLTISAMMPRGAIEDVFVSGQFKTIAEMPAGSCVGTSSARRAIILQREFPHLKTVGIRGNVQTRLRKCEQGDVDALILAAAGLERLDLVNSIGERLPIEKWLPAPGQGAIGIESRVEDDDILCYLKTINHQATFEAVMAECTVSRVLNGGCGVPLAAYAQLEKDELFLRAWWVSPEQQRFAYAEGRKHRAYAENLGREVANAIKQSTYPSHTP